MLEIRSPYLLCLGDVTQLTFAKTAKGILDWRPEKCAGQIRFAKDTVDLELPDMSIQEAISVGVKTLVLGVAPLGGRIPDSWLPTLLEALRGGMDIASGLHDKLTDIPEIVSVAKETGRNLYDVRHSSEFFSVGTGKKRTGKRLLAVGTDCAVGKMYSTLAIEKEMLKRSLSADFRATGQTGIFICGRGVSVDAVISDFVSGAAEALSPDNSDDHWDIIEGQGSLFHPSYAAVTLGLIHGSQPDALILCHEVGRTKINGIEDYPIPSLSECIESYLRTAKLTNKSVKFVGVCLNTSPLTEKEALVCMAEVEKELGLPCTDPYRFGVEQIVDQLEGC